jgi:hypothetical protein
MIVDAQPTSCEPPSLRRMKITGRVNKTRESGPGRAEACRAKKRCLRMI